MYLFSSSDGIVIIWRLIITVVPSFWQTLYGILLTTFRRYLAHFCYFFFSNIQLLYNLIYGINSHQLHNCVKDKRERLEDIVLFINSHCLSNLSIYFFVLTNIEKKIYKYIGISINK
jgi:hypothetical protein